MLIPSDNIEIFDCLPRRQGFMTLKTALLVAMSIRQSITMPNSRDMAIAVA